MATLVDVRKDFVQLSGRYDLVSSTSSYANNTSNIGADFFVTRGQKFLESKLGIRPRLFEFSKALVVGTYSYAFQDFPDDDSQYQALKAIKAVYLLTDDNDYKELLKISLQNWYNIFDSDTANGTPDYWTVGANASGTGNDTGTSSLLLWEPPDKTYTIKVIGFVGHESLTADTDKNYWTIVHPDILVKASLYELEVFYRNSEGARDWLSSLMSDVNGIDHDNVEGEISGITRMRDSWKPRSIGDTL